MRGSFIGSLFGVVAGALLLAADEPLDLLVVGGRVLDGSGDEGFYGDVGIRDGKIVAIGSLNEEARRTIHAEGKLVMPGFIDLHSHAAEGLASQEAWRRSAPNLVSQGITTVVVNQDGRSPWPIAQQRARLEQEGIGPNAVLMVGHGTVRQRAMGYDFRRSATFEEIQRMRSLVRQAMAEGAYGLSAGLEYPPGRWSTTGELVALVKEIAPLGLYISHMRSEGSDPIWYWPSYRGARPPTLLEALREAVQIGERTGVTVVASHIKAKGAHYWGSSQAAIQLIEEARARGVDIWADQYPYNTTGSDGNTVLIPAWALDTDRTGSEKTGARRAKPDPTRMLRRVLNDPVAAQKLRRDIAHEISRRGGPEKIVVLEHSDRSLVGKTLEELAAVRQVGVVEMVILLQLESFTNRSNGARIRGFSLSEDDIEAYASRPWTATSSDAGITLLGEGEVHPRFYGAFPRKLRLYALERGVLRLEDGVRSATSLPAEILGLQDRGSIRVSFSADLVVIDIRRLRDRATFFEPHQYAEGVEFVLANGQFLVENSKLTGALPGVVITPGKK